MTARVFFITITLSTGLFFASCEKDKEEDNQKPVISDLEVGHNDTIHAGEGIHLDFLASDNDLLDYYRIVIHAEDEHELKSAAEHIHWEFDSIFTEISGKKEWQVHHHDILIPENAELGEYHFHLMVFDQAGNLAETEKEVIVAEDDGEDHEHEHED